MSLPALLNPQTPRLLSSLSLSLTTIHIHKLSSPPQTLKFPKKQLHSLSPSFQSSHSQLKADDDDDGDDLEDHVIGDCVVFEDGVFEDPYLQNDTFNFNNFDENKQKQQQQQKNPKGKKVVAEIEAESLVPDKWIEVQAEINITKKERRKIAKEIEFNSRVEKRKKGYLPLRHVNLEEYKAFKEAKLAQLKPLVLDNPSSFPVKEEEEDGEMNGGASSERVAPKNPRWAVYGRGLDDVSQFLNSEKYEPGGRQSQGPRTLFTKEEKYLLNRRIPDLATATSGKWQPLHTLAASGEFYLVDTLLKHNVDINTVDMDGLTALHKAIICKKQAITNYLLRESASPFVRDEDGATLMHYAVQTASSPTIKLLLLYNVDINLQDNDGWTPLHLAVQAKRTDVVRLLLIKGADKTLKNGDGLTPLDLCLYSGRDTRTYELIKLLKQPPKQRVRTNPSHQHYSRQTALAT